MGVVYEAYDREREELVALKAMRSIGARALARFKREFRALHDLSHPNLVALGELFEGTSNPFYTMELIRGTSFLEYVRLDGALPPAPVPTSSTADGWTPRSGDGGSSGTRAEPAPPPRQASPIPYDERKLRATLKQLAMAVTAVHEAGMVHRDIKPPNVLVTKTGRVVLLDFGLVTETVEPSAPTPSSHAGVVGTVAYMAPEQAIAGRASPAADWYSVGVLLFEALTGSLPHTGKTAFDVILNKQRYVAAPPRQFVPDVPPDLDALCAGLLQTDVSERITGRGVFDRLGIESGDTTGIEALRSVPSVTSGSPFVGRSSELEQLHDAYRRSRTAPVVALLEGVSGVGKTRLAEAFLEELAESTPDMVVLSGRCYEREVVSYKAFDGIADALARYLAHLPKVEAAGLMPMHAGLLPRLFPTLRRVEAIASAPHEAEARDPHEQRRQRFAAMRELFSRMAERQPIVCFIDDLQWTDGDSLMLLQDLLGSDEAPPLLLIGTVRPVVDDRRRAQVATLDDLATTLHVPVDELSPEEARELARLLLPGEDGAAQRAVAADAGGHPLFLHALARHLSTSEDAAAGASLEEMIAARVERLPSSARRLLEVVALYGGPVTQEVAHRAAEMTRADLSKAIRMLRASHLVRTEGVRRTDRILPYHDRVREHIAAHLPPERSQRLHERIALALAQSDPAEQDTRALVRHARAAGQLARAAAHAHTAARHAADALAFDQAAEFFAIALELGDYGAEELRRLRLDLAEALVHAGRGPEAAELMMLAAEGADPAVRLDCQRQAAEQWINTGHLDRGMDALRASLAEIGEPLAASPRRALARVVWNRVRLRLRGLRSTPRLESQIAVESLRRLDVLRTVAHGLAMVDFIRGADFNGRFLRLALETGEPRRLIEALATEVVYLTSQGGGGAKRGRRVYERMTALFERDPSDAYAESWVHMANGAAKYFEGEYEAADQSLARCEEVLSEQTTGTTVERNNARVFRLLANRYMGRWRRCRALAGEAVLSGQQRGDRYLEATARMLRVPCLLASDTPPQADLAELGALWSPPKRGYHTQHYFHYNADVELTLYDDRVRDRADELQHGFATLSSSMLFRVQLVRVTALGLHGRVCITTNQPEAARDMAKRLGKESLGCAAVFEQLLRAALAPAGSHRAVEHLRSAVALADENDMALYLAAARDRLGRILGGDEGASLRAMARTYADQEGIVRPDRMYEGVAPGLLLDDQRA